MQTYTNNIKREMLISQESLPLRSHLVANLLKSLVDGSHKFSAGQACFVCVYLQPLVS